MLDQELNFVNFGNRTWFVANAGPHGSYAKLFTSQDKKIPEDIERKAQRYNIKIKEAYHPKGKIYNTYLYTQFDNDADEAEFIMLISSLA